jgi:hypothetical protein
MSNHNHHKNNTQSVVMVVVKPHKEFKPMNKNTIAKVVSSDAAKSAKIRELHAKGMKTGEIAKVLGIRYQFARNVIVREAEKVAKNAAK